MGRQGQRGALGLTTIGFVLASVALILAAASGVLSVVQLIRSSAPQLQWGSVAQWASAIGTTAAFFAGVVVIQRDNRLRRRDEERQRQADRRAQAELVNGYWDRDNDAYVIANASAGLVYRVGIGWRIVVQQLRF